MFRRNPDGSIKVNLPEQGKHLLQISKMSSKHDNILKNCMAKLNEMEERLSKVEALANSLKSDEGDDLDD